MKNLLRICYINYKGKSQLFKKISDKRFFELLSRATHTRDACYTLEELSYLQSKM